ncbi:hypothetical protein PAAG_11804 [Paracoccidioides lutzii Pb01]|uniref:Uncharacterized protein n=1 Tax=Paracoccidioides lutzii (strain ATCC MYA-826 / Pb01) TaxID=502779 RepID=A0A0A2V0V8_PARBA|nr:hypothetical protein PAAG_11804 [Paracoccidioides lutzii Pb01]KGQ01456.1 hypothetical protein PAAG_11804 [Paracoccidioides lutzii Pb01]
MASEVLKRPKAQGIFHRMVTPWQLYRRHRALAERLSGINVNGQYTSSMEQCVTTSKTLPMSGTRLYETVAGTILWNVERDKTIFMNVIVINMKFKTSNLHS